MELTLDLRKGKGAASVWVNGKWVSLSKNGKTEKSEIFSTSDPNEAAIAWTKELLAKSWTIDSLCIFDVKPGHLASVLDRLPRPARLHLQAKKLAAVDEIAMLPDLTALKLGGVTRATNLALLGRLPRLASLEILAGDGALGLAGVPRLPALRELEIHNVAKIDAAGLRRFPALESLTIGSSSLESLSFLREAGLALRKLCLHWIKAKGPLSLAPVEALAPTLTTLQIWLKDVTVTDAEAIARCTKVRSPDLKGVVVPGAANTKAAPSAKLVAAADMARPARPIKTKALKRGATAPAHFGGAARLANGETWPRCKNCKRPMPLFVEMDLAKLKLPKKVSGLLQFFYCNATDPQCEVECQSWDLNNRAMLLRVVPPKQRTAVVASPAVPSPVPARSVELGPEQADAPNREDAEDRYGVRDTPDRTLHGDKLLGWPAWVQGADWPKCAQCKHPMQHLLQLESHRGLAHQWGDNGRAYVFFCLDHPNRVGFVWQGG